MGYEGGVRLDERDERGEVEGLWRLGEGDVKGVFWVAWRGWRDYVRHVGEVLHQGKKGLVE